MQFAQLSATHRTGSGKSVTRKLRAAGQIPAICYGRGEEPIGISIDPAALLKALDPEKRANTVIKLTVNPDATSKMKAIELDVMIRDWQRNPLRGDLVHADFVRVYMDKEVHAVVPLAIIGKAKGIASGGTLHQVFRSLEVACTPDKIPTKIEVNVTELGLGEAIHVKDLPLPEGVRPLVDGSLTVCTVTVPRAEKAAAEGAEGAAAEGAAPAEAGKAEAKPAAGKAEAKPAAGKAEAKPAAKK